MANSDHRGDGAPPRDVHVGPATKKKNWLPWILLALGILALLFGMRRCSHDNESARVAAGPETGPAAGTAAGPAPSTIITPATSTGTATGPAAALPGTSGVGNYLAGTEPLPRTFLFEKLNFDTAKSDIRPADREELNMLGAALKQYPNARMRIVGYADARGTAPANATLSADRLETASGGETNPVDTNATAAGQAENRRTELVVLQR
jgi:outer membrane protein OmpA-like peptidoglycan-associated protein